MASGKGRTWRRWARLALVGTCCVPREGGAQVQVRPVEYCGWPGSVEIANAEARLVVVPAIGRIMHYALTEGDNVLWQDADQHGRVLPGGEPIAEDGQYVWTNFGGDKVWTNQQDQFRKINGHSWPPDHWFDGGAHSVQVLPDGVRLTSQVSEYCGARVVRTVRLAPQGSRVTIHQELEKVHVAARAELEPLEFTLWNVTQIRRPEQVLLPLNPHSAFESGYYAWDQTAVDHFRVEGDVGVFTPDSRSQKVGADTDRWLAAIVDGTVMAEFFDRDATQRFPDGGLSAEAYACADYVELELLSPLKALGVGEAMSFTIGWELKGLPAELSTPEARRQAAVEWLWAASSP